MVVPAGKSVEQKLRVDSEAGMKDRLFTINATAEYDVKGEQVQETILSKVSVSQHAGDGHSHLHNTGLEDSTPTNTTAVAKEAKVDGEGLSGPGVVAALLAVAFLGASVRRRFE